jgi:molybdate transport system substrate-binding protein
MRTLLPGLALIICAAAPALADNIKVLSAGAAKAAVVPLAEAFAKRTGHNVDIDFGTMGLIQEKLKKGERADVLIVSSEVADVLEKSESLLHASRRPLARVGIGVAVRADVKSPDISTEAAFRATLLGARSIVMINPERGTSGKHLVEVYRRLGITDALKPKMHYGEGGAIVEPVGRGEVEVGLHQISEILPVKGVKLVGPLPPSLQKWTVYVAGITPYSKVPDAGRELVDFLAGFQSRTTYLNNGFAVAD